MSQSRFLLGVFLVVGLGTEITLAEDRHYFVKAGWLDESVVVEPVDDYETVTVSLPNDRGARVTAKIISQSQVVDRCEVVALKSKGSRVHIVLKLGETNRDDGWNGCTAEIRRNHSADEDGLGVFLVDFGYTIDD